MINFADGAGKQVATCLSKAHQTTCVHGLWFDTVHTPGLATKDGIKALSNATSALLGEGFKPMRRQRLER